MKVWVVPPLGAHHSIEVLKQQTFQPHHHVSDGGRTRVQEHFTLLRKPAGRPTLGSVSHLTEMASEISLRSSAISSVLFPRCGPLTDFKAPKSPTGQTAHS